MPAEPPGPDAARRIQVICLILLTLVALGFAFAELGPVLVPFVVAVLVTYCLKPVTELQVDHLRLPRPLATTVTIFLGLGGLVALGLVATASIATMAGNIGPYREQLQEFVQRAAQFFPMHLLGLEADLETGVFRIPEHVTRTFIAAALGEATFLISNGALIFVFMLFMLIGTSRAPGERSEFMVAVERRVQRYLIVLFALSLSTGLLVGMTLYLLGVPFAMLFGFLAFLLNFIPNIGSIVATLLPAPVILLAPELTPSARVLALVLPAVIQFVIGNVVAPRVQGSAMHLHPVTVLMAVMFFGMIWGVAGAFLATPITAVVRIAVGRSAVMRPVTHLLDGDMDRFLQDVSPAPQSVKRGPM